MSDARLILTCGLPGSGKTTLAKQLAQRHAAVRLTKDEWHWGLGSTPWDREFGEQLESHLRAIAEETLSVGTSVVLDFGLWARVERDELLDTARALGVGVELHVLDAPLDEMWRRVDARNAVPPWNAAPISRSDLEEWRAVFEAPTAAETALYDAPLA